MSQWERNNIDHCFPLYFAVVYVTTLRLEILYDMVAQKYGALALTGAKTKARAQLFCFYNL